jgi:hypothetical protein
MECKIKKKWRELPDNKHTKKTKIKKRNKKVKLIEISNELLALSTTYINNTYKLHMMSNNK